MSDVREVVVVGSGLAGLSAALASARLGRRTTMLTGGVPGGQLVSINKIEGVPGFPDGVPGYDLCPMTQEQADKAGVEFSMAGCNSLIADGDGWRMASTEGDMVARAVIVATGTERAALGVPGEARLQGKGVSHCASCDAPLLRNQVAVVAGGGDSGLQEALTLAEHVSKVVVIERGVALTGMPSFQEQVRATAKIELRFGVVVSEILGESGVTHLRLKNVATGEESDLIAAAIFACTGLVPNTKLLGGLVPLDAGGRIRVDAAMRTRAAGLCAAGNVREGSPHRAAAAMGDGATAAFAIDRYLATGRWRDPD
ncbi:MAG TPA: FAD-dependent oxidoreductase [Steroidobacteraceae bacterium]|nr:FAD-dependent oxidoreductase [Steroidobacteraceae bacterium]